jgi:hypothetical protein
MQSLLETFSIGRASRWLATALGWSPLGRTVVVRSAEGPDSERLTGVRGRVVDLDGDTIVLDVTASGGGTPTRLRLTPRHKGWTGHSLLLASIAVVVEAGPSSRPAIAVLALERGQAGRE